MSRKAAIQDYQDGKSEFVAKIASELFLRDGIEAVKMTDIAEACHIGVATLYRRFKTKTAIIVESGIVAWNDIKTLVLKITKTASFQKKTGLEQIRELLEFFATLYKKNRNYITFISNFDFFILTAKKEDNITVDLSEYEKAISEFYTIFLDTYKKGYKDASIRKLTDYKTVYLSAFHALFSMAGKFISGEILPNDNFADADKEIKQIIDMTIFWIKAK